ncbi:CD3324 family protein [Brevibacillus reuszeri]|uniref:CD3324 family protein n=1 Tax=Brevibacillus reuszeri TaxID=54915 RepID=UPI00289A9241|nr:CD3324 family protein [Brevibacillus reuszeri]
MKYQNAQMLLPEELVRDIQRYVQGSYLYIPVQEELKKQWGDSTGSKKLIEERNQQIARAYHSGALVKELAQQFYLTEHSIRRIIRKQKRGPL